MLNIELLFSDQNFISFLKNIARKSMLDFDDYMQATFSEILESGCMTIHECKTAGWRVAKRQKKQELKEKAFSIRESDFDNYYVENGVLWESRHVLAV